MPFYDGGRDLTRQPRIACQQPPIRHAFSPLLLPRQIDAAAQPGKRTRIFSFYQYFSFADTADAPGMRHSISDAEVAVTIDYRSQRPVPGRQKYGAPLGALAKAAMMMAAMAWRG